MSSICILTDSAAQFPALGFSGKNEIRVIPFRVEFNGQIYEDDGKDLKAADLPPAANGVLPPRLIAPSVVQFQKIFIGLEHEYRHIIAILTSSGLTKAFENAQQAVELTRGKVNITLIDSQSTSVGLGQLVQAAAEAVAAGQSQVEVERLVRHMVPQTYMMMCTPVMSYLANSGFIDASQALAGEMLGILPIFTLEEGQLSSVEKVRNARGLVDFMQEFICEFDELRHIALIQSTPGMPHEAHLLREHAESYFPQTPFSELNINLSMAALIGPRSLSMVVVEKD